MNIEMNTILFHALEYPELVEPGPNFGSWSITEQLKSWLVKEDIKVFVEFSGDVAIFRFNTKHDCNLFFAHWRH